MADKYHGVQNISPDFLPILDKAVVHRSFLWGIPVHASFLSDPIPPILHPIIHFQFFYCSNLSPILQA